MKKLLLLFIICIALAGCYKEKSETASSLFLKNQQTEQEVYVPPFR